jgi:quercetin dioxygenase-like cupin family protein
MADDPVTTDPHLYRVVFENERVRVLEYRDAPGDRTSPHSHPDSVMVTVSDFERRLHGGDRTVDVSKGAYEVNWLPAQTHAGENIGDRPTHVFFVELKDPRPADAPGDERPGSPLGPTA